MNWLYGVGEIGFYVPSVIVGFFWSAFLLEVAEIPPFAASMILLGGSVWDALNEPLIGWLSDRTKSRFGRRRPWVALGAAPYIMSYVALWIVPPGSRFVRSIFYACMYLLFVTFGTVVAVPYVETRGFW